MRKKRIYTENEEKKAIKNNSLEFHHLISCYIELAAAATTTTTRQQYRE